MATHRIQSVIVLIGNPQSQPLHYVQPLMGRVLRFYIPIIKSWSNPGNIPLPWNCANVIKSKPHHSEEHQQPIKRKPTTTDLINYKYSTHTKLCHLPSGSSEWNFSNPCGGKRKSWTQFPFLFHLINTRNTKIKP